ncbi:MAG: MMPL family transporter [Oscillospiraceae bacterium]|nr:MMPL family transporter [Oscillospiraceae bacterium]
MKKDRDVMRAVSETIVSYRFIIILAFIVACVYCAMSVGRVKVNPDLTAFLPADTDTRKGITVMEDEFITYGFAEIMVSSLTLDDAWELSEKIAGSDHVTSVDFDDTTAHFVNASALFTVSFDGPSDDRDVIRALKDLREMLSDYDVYVNTEIGQDFVGQIVNEMAGVIAIAAAVIAVILLLTSRSYFEVVIFAIVFIVAALLNMGTNFWLGEISSISNAVAVILQLALAIDYAIIFSHRYQDEALVYDTPREALVVALSKSIIEISASSLTTISGLVALMLMQFRLGYDLGMVLSKGIICSLLTVFLLMPGLIMLFPNLLKKTAHKNHIPSLRPWGRFLMKTRVLFVIIFLLMIPAAVYCSFSTTYSFTDSSVDEIIPSESRSAMHRIAKTFTSTSTVAMIVPAEDFESEKAILNEVSSYGSIKSALGLAAIEIEPGHVLTDEYNARMFSELLGITLQRATLLYQAYGAEHQQYQAIFGDSGSYSVPLIDMFLYLFEKVDQGIVTLDPDTAETLNSLRTELQRGIDQLRGEHYNRLIFTASLPGEGEESVALVEKIRKVGERYYGEGNVLVVGTITSARDLADTYNSDTLKINLLTIAAIFTILLFTFRTVVGSLVLVFVIQGSIWINFSFPYLMDSHPSFVTYMIVSAIQMGATIDYAIVLMNRYQAFKAELPKREAMAEAVSHSFPTVFTSGSIMTLAGLLIAYRVSDVYVGHIGLAVGRGALISVILVLTVLPQLIVLCDPLIELTRIRISGGDR